MSEAAAAPDSPKSKGVLALVRNIGLAGSVVLAILGFGTLLSGPLFYRLGMMDIRAATAGVEQGAMAWFAVGLVLALFGLVVSLAMRSHKGAIVAIAAAIATGYGVGHLYGQNVLRGDLPPLYDAQTDWSQPVAYSEKLLASREAANAVRVRDDAVFPASDTEWSGMSFADAQKKVYDLEPLTVRASAPDATVAAAQAAKQLGWAVMLSDPQAGSVEAVSHSFWYGFTSDIGVRVVAEGDGARVDIRSTSREDAPDMGSNAAQVKALYNEIALILR
jgi:fatty-acyl-CoA synthase